MPIIFSTPQKVAVNIGNGSDVVGAIVVRNALDIGTILADLLDAPMQVADDALASMTFSPSSFNFTRSTP